ncbi:MAG: iron-sulfur cluster-binding protein [Gammaproteobacteria bacterium]|nr:MAG: iron-sulfur cluster-binding protein [Gammaproteobacteria bacterium]
MSHFDPDTLNSRFQQRLIDAIEDPQVRSNFRGAMTFLREKRAAQFDPSDFTQLQARAQAIRNRCLSKLPELLEHLESRCQANGIQVHWAQTGDAANRIIRDIIEAEGGRKVVKGKSMATEETGLNAALEAAGMDCVETDMGEYIVQLARETPSHIIMPAIHKNTDQIARLFHEQLGTPLTHDVDTLIGVGRATLRQKFEEADIGISGVNFPVAETGTLCLVENEGNGRMSTTVPRVHIALCGIEKVVEYLSDVPPLLHMLTRSATGQSITTYFNMISGPRKPGELDGPEQVHLVLLDNGRSRIYADPQLRQTLRCIRCGACMNHCPVYERVGGHAYGAPYPGPIGQVVAPQIWGLDKAGKLTQACSMNGACKEACPVGIPLPTLIRRLRREGVNHEGGPPLPGRGSLRTPAEAALWKVWAWLNAHPSLYRLFLSLATRLRGLSPRKLGGWTRYRAPVKPAPQSLHAALRSRRRAANDRS